MSARKLGRLIGLAFVLAAVLGGPSAAPAVLGHGKSVTAIKLVRSELVWG